MKVLKKDIKFMCHNLSNEINLALKILFRNQFYNINIFHTTPLRKMKWRLKVMDSCWYFQIIIVIIIFFLLKVINKSILRSLRYQKMCYWTQKITATDFKRDVLFWKKKTITKRRAKIE